MERQDGRGLDATLTFFPGKGLRKESPAVVTIGVVEPRLPHLWLVVAGLLAKRIGQPREGILANPRKGSVEVLIDRFRHGFEKLVFLAIDQDLFRFRLAGLAHRSILPNAESYRYNRAVESLDPASITEYIRSELPGVDVLVASAKDGAPEIAWGDTFFFYDPERRLEGATKFPFATIVTKDYGEFDNASKLDRDGVYRLNIGVRRETYDSLFPSTTESHDFAQLDVVMPHPVYSRNHWLCVLNPSARTFDGLKPLIAEAHSQAMRRYEKLTAERAPK